MTPRHLRSLGATFQAGDSSDRVRDDGAGDLCCRRRCSAPGFGDELRLIAFQPDHAVLQRLEALIDDLERLPDFRLEAEQVFDLAGECPELGEIGQRHELGGDAGRA